MCVRLIFFNMSRRKDNIYLIGPTAEKLEGSKLPSQKEVLSVLFFKIRNLKIPVHDSAKQVANECVAFWKKGDIPTSDVSYCIKKVELLYENWRKLDKNKTRNTDAQKANVKEFVESLDMLFDIAHADAFKLIKLDEDRKFLAMQREPGRPGYMAGIDYTLLKKENEKTAREEKQRAFKRKADDEAQCSKMVPTPAFSSAESSEAEDSANLNESMDIFEANIPKPEVQVPQANQNFLTPRLCAALDRAKVSDRDATHILIACLEALEKHPEEYILNRESVRVTRQQNRQKTAQQIKSDFMNSDSTLDFVIVHWDSKLLKDLTGDEKVDRLPVVVTGPNLDQLLGVPEIPSSTGYEMASAIYDSLESWNLTDKVQGCVFDTTASNSGRINGACTLFEQKLGREILFLACRHHIMELILQAAVTEAKLYVSSGPDIPIFKRFKESWASINKLNIHDWSSNEQTSSSLASIRENLTEFCREKIKDDHPREDYREFLQLVLIVLGGTAANEIITIRKPGVYHQARWMSKAIYCLKIFLFRRQFHLSKPEETALVRIVIFIIKIYVKPWSLATDPLLAAINDIELLRNLLNFQQEDKKMADCCLKKILNHLWYLNEELAALSLFNDDLSVETRKKMAQILLNNSLDEDDSDYVQESTEKKLSIKLQHLSAFLDDDLPAVLLSRQSLGLFQKLKIDTSFLELEPTDWKNNSEYLNGKRKVMSLKIVNDTAERAVKLMDDFNNKITKNENQKQFLLQVVKKYRQTYKNENRSSLKAQFFSAAE